MFYSFTRKIINDCFIESRETSLNSLTMFSVNSAFFFDMPAKVNKLNDIKPVR